MNLTEDAVLALAPDAASAKAAKGLVAPAQWPTLGVNEDAVWGECQGSGAKPYQTQVDLSGPVFRCSCPSRKFPCKHGLALLLMRAQVPERFTEQAAPTWVTEWLASRAEKAHKKEEKQQAAEAKAADPESAARTQAKRWARIESAAFELQRWLADQLRLGLGNLGTEQRKEWEQAAARLVDAQAPGLAQRLRDAAQFLSRREMAGELLSRLGQIQLACEAVQRRESLSTHAQADVRTLVGWPLDRTEVLAATSPVPDSWTVLGQICEEREGKLIERRVWLHGERSGSRALLLDHSYGGKGFEQAWITGAAYEARLAFYPGSAPLRALLVDSTKTSEAARWPQHSCEREWGLIATRIATCPWTILHPIVWSDAVPYATQGGFSVAAQGQHLPLDLPEEEAWILLAITGGHPVTLAGEWDGRAIRPLAAQGADSLWQRRLA